MALWIQRRMGLICIHCDANPKYYRKLTEEKWVNYSVCPDCGHISNFFLEDVSALDAANKRYEICRQIARMFIPQSL